MILFVPHTVHCFVPHMVQFVPPFEQCSGNLLLNFKGPLRFLICLTMSHVKLVKMSHVKIRIMSHVKLSKISHVKIRIMSHVKLSKMSHASLENCKYERRNQASGIQAMMCVRISHAISLRLFIIFGPHIFKS